jgi:membrane-associated PAP2 superfamily phosphatase
VFTPYIFYFWYFITIIFIYAIKPISLNLLFLFFGFVCILKPIRIRLFYLYFQKIHIDHIIGNYSFDYTKFLINKFDKSLDLFVHVQNKLGQDIIKVDYLRYSNDIRNIIKTKNKEKYILLLFQKLNMTNRLDDTTNKKLKYYSRMDKIKSIL